MMATTKIWPVKYSLKHAVDYVENPEKTEFNDLKAVLEYAADDNKTGSSEDKIYLTTGINCRAETAYEEMSDVKFAFGKTDGNVAYHAYQSFKPGEVSPEECHEIGVKLAKELWGDRFQVLIATHLDKEHRHNHFIINSVSYADGRKFNDNYKTYRDLREASDRICSERNLSVIDNPRGRTPRELYFAEKNGEPTKYNLMREAMDDAISMSTNREMFNAVLRKKGYVVTVDDNRKYPVIRSIYGGRNTRLFRLGDDYEPQRIMERIYENGDDAHGNYNRFLRETRTVTPVRHSYIRKPRTKRKLTGLYGMYIRYLYVAGYRPKRPHYQPITLEMKEAMRKCDEYAKQARLLGREKLETVNDVKDFIIKCESSIEEMSESRRGIYNKLRRCEDPDEISLLKSERDSLTKTIRDLRNDLKTAHQVLDRSETIKQDLIREQQAQAKENQRTRGFAR